MPNSKSKSFHEAFGFKNVGVYHNVGYKLNGWRDVLWMEYAIAKHSSQPLNPKMINEIKNSTKFNEIVGNALKMIKY